MGEARAPRAAEYIVVEPTGLADAGCLCRSRHVVLLFDFFFSRKSGSGGAIQLSLTSEFWPVQAPLGNPRRSGFGDHRGGQVAAHRLSRKSSGVTLSASASSELTLTTFTR